MKLNRACSHRKATGWQPVLLKHQLQSQLNLARECCGRGDQPGRWTDGSAGENGRIGWSVIRSIQDVEELSAKLQISFFGDAGVFEQGKIDVRESRPAQRPSSQISIRSGDRQNESSRIKPLIRISRNDRPDEGWIERWPVRISSVTIARAIRADKWRKGEAGEKSPNPVHLPAGNKFALDS